MRALFLELLVDRLLAEGLGIGHGCLYEMARQIDSILQRHRNELADRQTFLRAYADLAEFVSRMAADARAGGSSDLHEHTFFSARSQCGLIFWCE